jgi:hypothetical protein
MALSDTREVNARGHHMSTAHDTITILDILAAADESNPDYDLVIRDHFDPASLRALVYIAGHEGTRAARACIHTALGAWDDEGLDGLRAELKETRDAARAIWYRNHPRARRAA